MSQSEALRKAKKIEAETPGIKDKALNLTKHFLRKLFVIAINKAHGGRKVGST